MRMVRYMCYTENATKAWHRQECQQQWHVQRYIVTSLRMWSFHVHLCIGHPFALG